MSAYSKLIGSLAGGVAGILLSKFALPASLTDPAVVAAVTTLLGAVVTFFAPANKPAS